MSEIVPLTTGETEPNYFIPIVGTFPGMDPSVLDLFTPDGTQALLLESNAHAALATNLHQKDKRARHSGYSFS